MSKRAVFFDRDDTLMVDVPYCGAPSRVRLLPYAHEALATLKASGFLLFIVSNQSGVGRGLITEKQVHEVNQELVRQLGEDFFTGIYLCFAAPWENDNNCRKPNPGLILRARDEHDLSLEASFLVGDKPADVLCAKNAGCKSVLVMTGTHGEQMDQVNKQADYIARDLLQAAEWICQFKKESKS